MTFNEIINKYLKRDVKKIEAGKENVKKENEKSPKTNKLAKDRLHVLLVQDRASVSAEFIDLMKEEIIEVVKKYVIIDNDEIDLNMKSEITEDGKTKAGLVIKIPILNIRNEMKSQKVREDELEAIEKRFDEKKEDALKTEETIKLIDEEASKKENISELEFEEIKNNILNTNNEKYENSEKERKIEKEEKELLKDLEEEKIDEKELEKIDEKLEEKEETKKEKIDKEEKIEETEETEIENSVEIEKRQNNIEKTENDSVNKNKDNDKESNNNPIYDNESEDSKEELEEIELTYDEIIEDDEKDVLFKEIIEDSENSEDIDNENHKKENFKNNNSKINIYDRLNELKKEMALDNLDNQNLDNEKKSSDSVIEENLDDIKNLVNKFYKEDVNLENHNLDVYTRRREDNKTIIDDKTIVFDTEKVNELLEKSNKKNNNRHRKNKKRK